jgi:uncharacterized membrane protein (DUF441 family)
VPATEGPWGARGRRGGRTLEGGGLDALVILGICAGIGLLGRNALIVAAAASLGLIRLLGFQGAIRWLDQRGTTLGIFLLIISLLAPVALDRISLRAFVRELLRPSGWIGLGVAAAAAYLGRGGVTFLKGYPTALVGLIVGSVLGTIFLGGVPTGPLIAAGVTALLLQALGQH